MNKHKGKAICFLLVFLCAFEKFRGAFFGVLGERLYGIQEVKSSILSVSTNSILSNYFFAHFQSGCFFAICTVIEKF